MSNKLQAARAILSSMTNKHLRNFESQFSPLNLLSATDDGTVHCQWKIDAQHLNRGGSLHGGCTASIVDEITGFSLMVAKGKLSVSTEINVSYFRPAKEGQLLDIHSKITRAGKTMAFLEAEFVNESGELVASGKHTVVILDDLTIEQFIENNMKYMNKE